MRANRLEAADGLRWIAESFLIFRFAPLRQLLYGLAFLFALMVAMSLPLAGFALVWLLVPALLVGPHEIARHYVCGLCNPPARAGKGRQAGSLRASLEMH